MIGGVSYGQDPQYSQFYAAPLYLNPAFTGSTQLSRVGMNYRNQWPSIDASFVTYAAFADHFFVDVNSGVGIMVQSDRALPVGLRNQGASLFYAYQLPVTPTWTFRAGFEGGYYFRDLDYSKLLFGSQINDSGIQDVPSGEIFSTNWKVNFFDISIGGLLYSGNFWVGFSGSHLNKPNLSLLKEDGGVDHLPIKYSLHAGYRVNLRQGSKPGYFGGNSKSIDLYPALNYRVQGEYMQFDAGAYVEFHPVMAGIWYRGIPIRQVNNIKDNESIIFSIGFSSNGLNIGYSFDYTLSQLGIESGGAHEVSVSYEFFLGNPRKPPKNVRKIPCPRL